MFQKLLAGLSFLSLGIPIALLILSAVSFGSCPNLATWIIVFCAVAIASLVMDIILRRFTYEDSRSWIPYILYIVVNLFFLAWDAYGIYLLAVPGKACNTYGWSQYNYIITAILVALDLLASFIFLGGLARSMWKTFHHGGGTTSKPVQVYQ